MSREFNNIDERLNYIEFRQQLLFSNTNLDRLIFEYELTSIEFNNIMDLFDEIRDKLLNGEKITNSYYESEMYKIVPSHKDDYYMCEYIARAMMDEGRWVEVFPALYGNMPKYSYLKDENGDGY